MLSLSNYIDFRSSTLRTPSYFNPIGIWRPSVNYEMIFLVYRSCMTIITLLNYHLDLRSICMIFFSSPHHREISVIIWELDLKGVKRICRFPLHIPLKSVSLKRPAKTVCTSPNSIKAFLTGIFETVVGRYIVTKIVLESSLVPWRPWPLFE